MAFLFYLLINLVVWTIVIYNMRSISQKTAALMQHTYPKKWQDFAGLADKQGIGRWRYSYMWQAIKRSPEDFGAISNIGRLSKARESWLAFGLASIPLSSIAYHFLS